MLILRGRIEIIETTEPQPQGIRYRPTALRRRQGVIRLTVVHSARYIEQGGYVFIGSLPRRLCATRSFDGE
jgi:hypothetical protein